MSITRPLILIVNGSGGVGKDTICDILSKHINTRVFSSITPIKEIAKEIGWCGEKTPEARKMLSDLKDICTEYSNLPFRYMCECLFMTEANEPDIYLVVFHIREPEEIAKFIDYAKKTEHICKTLLIKSSRTMENYGNHADDNVENFNYDMVYQNDGTLENLESDFMEFWREKVWS